MSSPVYYGDARQCQLEANETLPAKLDLILEKLHLRDRVKGEKVVLKMHTGNNLSYSTVHPVFVRKVVQAIKDGGGTPFVVDVDWDVHATETRGYTAETLGCPIYPAAGLKEKYYYEHHFTYKNLTAWRVAGMIEDATFLVNFAHAKGHPSCGYGGAIKNLALGCMTWPTRSAMHDTNHFDPYWFRERCPDAETRQKIIAACPHGAVVEDKQHPEDLHVHFDNCNQCGRCLRVAPEGSLKISPVNFHAFQEACAISTKITLSTFKPGQATHLVLATHMTPVCDCFGFTSLPILHDSGIYGSDDIVALDQAVLDGIGRRPLIEDNVPTSLEVWQREGHPLAWLHGPLKDPYKVTEYLEALGCGSRQYELVDVMPVAQVKRAPLGYVAAG